MKDHVPTQDEANLIREFLSLLDAEEGNIIARLTQDRLGLALRVALNELDWHKYGLAHREGLSDEVKLQTYVVDMGLGRVISLMLRLHDDFTVPTITVRRQDRLVRQLLDMAAELGFIEQGRRTVELVWAGIARISRPEPLIFDFELPHQISDAEAHERDVVEHYKREHLRLTQEALSASAGARWLSGEITNLLRENVYVWRDSFIGYNADPVLDDYYMALAWTAIRETPQYDSFNERKTFGGIPFLKYLLASAWLVSLCLKHEAFCEALIAKHPEIRLEDILTISADRAEFIDTLRQALDQTGMRFVTYTTTSLEEAEQIFEVVTLTRRNAKLIEKPVAPIPVIVQSSTVSIVKFLAGRHRQMEFMLDSLKANFARDFSLNQQTREASMQRVMEEFFREHFASAIVRRNIRLRHRGRELTDIDFAVFDPAFGDLLLFQIKYQDAHGADFKVRNSRMARFVNESMRWLTAVDTWLENAGPEVLRNAFRLPAAGKVTRIRKIIVARHHAYPLAKVQLDEDTAYASWMQLYNAGAYMGTKQGNIRTLNGLFSTLRAHIVGAAARFHEDLEPLEYRLANVSFRVRQSEGDPTEHPASINVVHP
ncbi:hypothetical protein [Sphingomonas sp. 179-A 2A2 NHS]|uniref:hypothetical protein n=1 Tax=Sphingomonas sp. 179-A 2A2 NHS TaxID=3374290 RepID=UPI003879BA1F